MASLSLAAFLHNGATKAFPEKHIRYRIGDDNDDNDHLKKLQEYLHKAAGNRNDRAVQDIWLFETETADAAKAAHSATLVVLPFDEHRQPADALVVARTERRYYCLFVAGAHGKENMRAFSETPVHKDDIAFTVNALNALSVRPVDTFYDHTADVSLSGARLANALAACRVAPNSDAAVAYVYTLWPFVDRETNLLQRWHPFSDPVAITRIVRAQELTNALKHAPIVAFYVPRNINALRVPGKVTNANAMVILTLPSKYSALVLLARDAAAFNTLPDAFYRYLIAHRVKA